MYITVMSYRSFVTQDFHTELMQIKFAAVINQKLVYMAEIGMGGDHHKYCKHTKFCLKFLKF